MSNKRGKIVWSDIWYFVTDFEEYDSTHIGFRLFLFLIIQPIKYLILTCFVLVIMMWVFSGFGIFWVICSLAEGSLDFLSWVIIVFDLIGLSFYTFQVVVMKNK